MATLITQVDRLSGNYEQVFVYSLNASFNGIEGDINSATIKFVIPSYLNIFLGDVRDPVKNVTQNPVPDGTEVVLDFGKVTDLGIAVRIGFGVTFKTTALNGEAFELTSVLNINGVDTVVSVADIITLELNPQFEITREIVLPTATPSYGSAVFYKLTLQNFGDLGAEILNTVITCNGTEFITIDPNYPVEGNDVSSKFEDKTANGITPTFGDNTLVFTIPSYRGEKYEFIYRAVIDSDIEVGTELTSTATWSIDSEAQASEIHEITLAEPIYSANISIYAPDYSLPSEYICYRININNTGNQILFNSLFENNLPPEVDYYQFSTGSFNIGAIKQNLSAEYYIDYETVGGVTGEIGPFNTDVSTTINLSTIIPEGDNLSVLYWKLNTLGIGAQSKSAPQLLGIVKAETPIDSSLINHIHLTYDNATTQSELVENATTLIANYCTLNPTLISSVGGNPIRPNDVIQYRLSVNCRQSRLKNPIIAMLLPPELEFYENVDEGYTTEYFYGDIFTGISPSNPPVKIIPNFTSDEKTLVKFEFTGENAFSFRQLATINIRFHAKVAIGAYGNISNFMLLNSSGSTGVIPNNIDIYTDNDGIAESSTVSKNYAKSNVITNAILYFVSTSSNKKVKGLLDDKFIEEPAVGKTVNGGSLEYQITVKNIGNANLESVEIVDILPHIGDTGVIETGSARNSEFPIYALTEVAAVLLPSGEEVGFDISYSTSTDPVRFGGNFDVIGTDDNWTTEPPEDLSILRSFKVSTGDIVLTPNESLRVGITATVPVGIETSKIAWNSFATDVKYTDINGVKQSLLAVEPEKVGIEISDSAPDTVKISGYSWVDDDGNGYYEDDESYVNDVLVILYDEENNIVRFTSTTTDINGNDGQYAFENLAKGKYTIGFVIDSKELKFTTQRKNTENGSKADRKSGKTDPLDLTELSEITNINVGILPKEFHTLAEITKINNQARGVLRDVVKNQMLLTMKQEDVLEILQNDLF